MMDIETMSLLLVTGFLIIAVVVLLIGFSLPTTAYPKVQPDPIDWYGEDDETEEDEDIRISKDDLDMAKQSGESLIGRMCCIEDDFNDLVWATYDHNVDAGWWKDIADSEYAIPTKLVLIHSEISEAMEADRRSLADDKLKHRMGIEAELADAVIRILDLAGHLDIPLGTVIREKMEFNLTREDHTATERAKTNGKRY